MSVRTEVLEILVSARETASKTLEKVGVEAEATGSRVGKMAHNLQMGMAAAGVAAAGVIAISVKQAAEYQTLTTALVTGAGETEANIDIVSRGMLAMAGQVGVTAQDLAKGMYMIESAGFHGASGLLVLRASAEGAKIGMADQTVVADALTTVLKDYHLSASDAAGVTGQMVAAVAAGKMHFGDFSASLSKVLPIAAALHIPFQQIAAAEATMTAHGMNAAKATTAIQAGIMQLVNPSKNAGDAIYALGIPLKELQTRLASGDLTGALTMFQQGIAQSAAKGMSQADITKNMVAAFGGVRGGALALNLLPNMGEYKANITAIGTSQAGAAKLASGWALVQKDLNTQLEKMNASLQTVAIEIGTALLPPLTQAVEAITTFLQPVFAWISANPKLAAGILVAVAALGLLAGGMMVVTAAMGALDAVFSPVILIIAALAAIGYLLYRAWQSDFGGIREIVAGVWAFLQTAFKGMQDAVNRIRAAFGKGGLGAAVAELGSMLGSAAGQVGAFIGNLLGRLGSALPGILKQLNAWALAFVAWIGPMIPPFLAELGKMLLRFILWFGQVYIAVYAQLGKWALAFVVWVAPMALKLLVELAKLYIQVTLWIAGVAKDLAVKMLDVGRQMIQGMMNGIGSMKTGLKNKLGDILGGAVGDTRAFLHINSPSLVFHGIGQSIGEGLINGIASMAGAVGAASTGLAQTATSAHEHWVNGYVNKLGHTVAGHFAANPGYSTGSSGGSSASSGGQSYLVRNLAGATYSIGGSGGGSSAAGAVGASSSGGSGAVTVNITIAAGAITVDGHADSSKASNFGEHIKSAIDAVVRSQLMSQPGPALTAPGMVGYGR